MTLSLFKTTKSSSSSRRVHPPPPSSGSTIPKDFSESLRELVPTNDNDYDYDDLFDAKNSNRDDHSRNDCPAIVNNTGYPIVVFLARGFLYNEAVLKPKEALICTKKQTKNLPYRVHAVIGNEENLPTKGDSWRNLARVSVVPAAFVAGCLVTAATGGGGAVVASSLTGPSAVLARMVGGMVIKGVVIDATAIAAGALTAKTAKQVAAKVLEEHQANFCGQTGVLWPGRRYLSVTGGIEKPVQIREISRRRFRKTEIVKKKVPVAIAIKREERSSASPRELTAGRGQ